MPAKRGVPPRGERRVPERPNGDLVFQLALPKIPRFEPPMGVNPAPFEEIETLRSTFLVKVVEGRAEEVDPTVLTACAEALFQAASLIEMPEEVDTLMDKKEYFEYVSKYTDTIAAVVEQLVAAGKNRIAICAAPVGGLSPLQGVMKKFAERYHEDPIMDKVDFFPFARDQRVYDRIQKADATVLVDDGLARFSTQIEPLYAVMSEAEVDNMLRTTKHQIQEKGDINDPSLAGLYTEIMRRLAKHNMVAVPLFAKNTLWEPACRKVAGEQPDNAVAQAQVKFLEDFDLEIIDQRGEYPGGMIDGVPCRDLGVTLGQILKMLDVDVRERLENAGIPLSTTFRLLGNRPDILSIEPKDGKPGVVEATVDKIVADFAVLLNAKLKAM